jgi:hypothetical protein
MEPEILQPFTSPYAEPDKSIPPHAVLFYDMHFNIILPCMHKRSQWFLSFSCFHKINEFFLFSMLAMCLAHLFLLDLITLILFGEEWSWWNSCLCSFPCYAVVSFLYITSLFRENLRNRMWRTAELWHLKISVQIITVFLVNFRLTVAQYYLSFILILPAHFLRNSLGIPSVFNKHWRGSASPLVQPRSFTTFSAAVYILRLHTSFYSLNKSGRLR